MFVFVHEASQAQCLHIRGCRDVVHFLSVLHYLQARRQGGEKTDHVPVCPSAE